MTITQELLTNAFPNPPSSPAVDITEPVRTKELAEIPNPRTTEPEPLPWRCQFTFSDGRQCRLPRYDFHVCLCRYHMDREQELFAVPESPDHIQLDALSADLTTATGINRALAQVFHMLAHKRIAQREAVTFAYLAQLLLQTVPGVRTESVSAFGFNAWQEKLKDRLAAQPHLGAVECAAGNPIEHRHRE